MPVINTSQMILIALGKEPKTFHQLVRCVDAANSSVNNSLQRLYKRGVIDKKYLRKEGNGLFLYSIRDDERKRIREYYEVIL